MSTYYDGMGLDAQFQRKALLSRRWQYPQIQFNQPDIINVTQRDTVTYQNGGNGAWDWIGGILCGLGGWRGICSMIENAGISLGKFSAALHSGVYGQSVQGIGAYTGAQGAGGVTGSQGSQETDEAKGTKNAKDLATLYGSHIKNFHATYTEGKYYVTGGNPAKRIALGTDFGEVENALKDYCEQHTNDQLVKADRTPKKTNQEEA